MTNNILLMCLTSLNIRENEYEQIDEGIALVMLKFEFDSTENKEIDVYINKQLLEIETDNIGYNTRINDFLQEGENTIELIARTDVKVEKLKVDLE